MVSKNSAPTNIKSLLQDYRTIIMSFQSVSCLCAVTGVRTGCGQDGIFLAPRRSEAAAGRVYKGMSWHRRGLCELNITFSRVLERRGVSQFRMSSGSLLWGINAHEPKTRGGSAVFCRRGVCFSFDKMLTYASVKFLSIKLWSESFYSATINEDLVL